MSRTLIIAVLFIVAAVSASSNKGGLLADVLAGEVITAEKIKAWLCQDEDTCPGPRDEIPLLRDKFATRIRRSLFSLAKTPLDNSAQHNLPNGVRLFLKVAQKRVAHLATEGEVLEAIAQLVKESRGGDVAADKYSIFGFMPSHRGNSAVAGNTSLTFSTKCWTTVTVTTRYVDVFGASSGGQEAHTTITTAGQKELFCSDTVLLTALGPRIALLDAEMTKTYQWDLKAASDDRKWYFAAKGVHVYTMPGSLLETIGQLIDTVLMFTGFGVSPLPKFIEEKSVTFMRDYVEFDLSRMGPQTKARTAGNVVALPMEEHIQTGDSFIVLRMDGLDPMIAWGEGWTSGHSVIAIRDPAFHGGKLHVCESTAKDAYWPRNGIQCTPYPQWIKQAEAAEFNVLLAPLDPTYRAAFNSSKAIDFFKKWEGVNYGYVIFLFGWIDNVKNNFPCVPPHFDRCLDETMVESIAILIDTFMGDANNNIFRWALNHRAGTTGYDVLKVLRYAETEKNLTFPDLYTMVEQDKWRYNMTMNDNTTEMAPAMVCCVFVCHMWKAAGLFASIDHDIECGEQTLWDIFSMGIFDKNKTGTGRPQVCQTADPVNPLCQLLGNYTFEAKPDFNTRKLYKQMGDHCSSKAPQYVREDGC